MQKPELVKLLCWYVCVTHTLNPPWLVRAVVAFVASFVSCTTPITQVSAAGRVSADRPLLHKQSIMVCSCPLLQHATTLIRPDYYVKTCQLCIQTDAVFLQAEPRLPSMHEVPKQNTKIFKQVLACPSGFLPSCWTCWRMFTSGSEAPFDQ